MHTSASQASLKGQTCSTSVSSEARTVSLRYGYRVGKRAPLSWKGTKQPSRRCSSLVTRTQKSSEQSGTEKSVHSSTGLTLTWTGQGRQGTAGQGRRQDTLASQAQVTDSAPQVSHTPKREQRDVLHATKQRRQQPLLFQTSSELRVDPQSSAATQSAVETSPPSGSLPQGLSQSSAQFEEAVDAVLDPASSPTGARNMSYEEVLSRQHGAVGDTVPQAPQLELAEPSPSTPTPSGSGSPPQIESGQSTQRTHSTAHTAQPESSEPLPDASDPGSNVSAPKNEEGQSFLGKLQQRAASGCNAATDAVNRQAATSYNAAVKAVQHQATNAGDAAVEGAKQLSEFVVTPSKLDSKRGKPSAYILFALDALGKAACYLSATAAVFYALWGLWVRICRLANALNTPGVYLSLLGIAVIGLITPQTPKNNTLLQFLNESGFFANYGEAKKWLNVVTYSSISLLFASVFVMGLG